MRFEVDAEGLRSAGDDLAACSSSLRRLMGSRLQDAERDLRRALGGGEEDAAARVARVLDALGEDGLSAARGLSHLADALGQVAACYERADDDALEGARSVAWAPGWASSGLGGGTGGGVRARPATERADWGPVVLPQTPSGEGDGPPGPAREVFEAMVRPL